LLATGRISLQTYSSPLVQGKLPQDAVCRRDLTEESPRVQFPFRLTWKALLLSTLFTWAYLPTLRELLDKWLNDPQYSHGILVPLLAAYLLWNSKHFTPTEARPWPWVGFGVLLLALACRAVAAALFFLTLDGLSLLLCLTGIVLTLGGGATLRHTWRPLVFL